MAYLRKVPGSRNWSIQWVTRDEDGRRVWHTKSTGEPNYDKAMEIVKAFDDALKGKLNSDRIAGILKLAGAEVPENVKLTELWDWYQAHCDLSGDDRTQRDRYNTLTRFIAWMAKTHPEFDRVREVTLRIASEYWIHLADEGKSASTRNNNLSQLNTIWSNIHAPMELPCNPWGAIKRDTGGSIRYQPFTMAELDKLRKTALTFTTNEDVEPGFWPAAIEIGFYTGLRLGDIATLDWTELSVDGEFLVLVPNKTKHWDSDRVAVHSLSLPWVGMLPPRQADGELWPLAAGLYRKTKLSSEFTALAKKAGIQLDREPEGKERRQMNVKLKTFHSLRHTFATVMLKAGLADTDLRDQGNWSGTDVINQHYNHAKLEMAKDAARKVAEAMRSLS